MMEIRNEMVVSRGIGSIHYRPLPNVESDRSTDVYHLQIGDAF